MIKTLWNRYFPLLLSSAVGLGISLAPVPLGLEERAWHLFAIFVATIFGIVTKALAVGALALLSFSVATVTGVLDLNQALSGFSQSVIWLIAVAFFISRAFVKTGLGKRIAYHLIVLLGKRSLGLSYGLALADLVLAPAIPSSTARAGGILYPIAKSLAQSFGSDPDNGTSRKIGSFLIKSVFQCNLITSAMFLTAMAANPLAVKMAADLGVDISWGSWALYASVPGLVSLCVIPLFLYWTFPPEIKLTPDAPDFARRELKSMGQVTWQEWVMMAVFALLLILWIGGNYVGINPTTTAFLGLSILVVTGVLTWDDILGEKSAWDALVWFAVLVMMAGYLNEFGFIPWFTNIIKAHIADLDWKLAYPLLALAYFYSHYLFASNTAHVSSMYAAFLAVGIAVGISPLLMAVTLGYFSNLFASTTHYGTGPAPVLFGSGYVDVKSWWLLGFAISVINILIWMGLGGLWWGLLGVW